ncbi:MAG: T9SS type A sorting domain-containing protein [Bacteroidia bacterium]|nr:T9SS type A sorting domain-containing protein [Bacteroidia bacterium]
MKRLLLFSLAIGITIGAVAQNKFAVRNNNLLPKKANVTNVAEVDIPYLPSVKPHGAHTKALNGVQVGTSGNVFGYLLGAQNWLDYNPATNAVMFTHRRGGAWGGSSGDLVCKFSTDWFNTLHDSVLFLNTGAHFYRYPSGVIYNPAGNTNVDNAFAVVGGPLLMSAFGHNYYCSQKLDATLLDTNYIPIVAPYTALERTNLSGGNGNVYMQSQDDDGTNYFPYVKVRKGVFNTTTNAFDWSLVQTQLGRLFGKRIFGNGASDADYAWNQAWANDGMTGYAFCTGIDSTMKHFQGAQLPQIWRTVDGGVTYQTLAPFACFDALTNLTDSIWPTMASVTGGGTLEYRPFFNAGSTLDDNTLPGVVDANGNLHMAAIIEGYYSNYVGVEDSTGYSYTNHPKFLFDVIYDWQTQLWDVRFIDVINSAVVLDDNGAAVVSSSGNMGWEHYINVSRSDDGNVIFFTWTDTDPSYGTDNIVPDIKGRAWRITDNMATASKNFTDPNGGLYYYVNTADIAAKNGSTYSIGLTYIDVAGDGGNNGDGPQILYFATDVNFDESEFTVSVPASDPLVLGASPCLTGVPSTEVNTMSVSQNYPNPVNGITNIKVTLAETSNVAVEITNMVGQLVSKVDKGRLAAGSHGINLNVANLNSGIYFYTVTAGTQKITKKMIVE